MPWILFNTIAKLLCQYAHLRQRIGRDGKYKFLTPTERETVLERLSVRNSINNLRTFPYVKEREADGRLRLHGAWFDISTGELWVMNPETGDFSRPELPPEA